MKKQQESNLKKHLSSIDQLISYFNDDKIKL